jgi:hypothetical protein
MPDPFENKYWFIHKQHDIKLPLGLTITIYVGHQNKIKILST